MRIFLLSLIVLLAAHVNNYGQVSLNKVLEIGESSFASRDYYSAYQCYKTLLEYPEGKYDADAVYVQYRLGLSAQRFNYLEQANIAYRTLLAMPESSNTEYEALGVFNRAMVLFSMGTDAIVDKSAQEVDSSDREETFRKADSLFTVFLDQSLSNLLERNQQSRYNLMANTYKKECEKALSGLTQVKNDEVTRLVHPDINSRFSDLGPVLVDDQLYFSSLRHFPPLRKAKRQSRTYSKVHKAQLPGANPLDTNIQVNLLREMDIYNSDQLLHTVHTAFTADRQQMFFSSCTQKGEEIICHLYRRLNQGGGQWGAPEKLDINAANEEVSSTQPSVTVDCSGKQWLYFSSNREGSVGGFDIWRSEIKADGSLSTPQNVRTVNTKWDENTPYWHPISNKLYFSSDAPPGFGMHDLYFAYEKAEGGFGPRKNLGTPVNSGYNDQYYFITTDGDRAYFSSDRPSSMRFVDSLNACCQDIYTLEIDNSMELEVELFSCYENNTVAVDQASVSVFEVNCGEKQEIEGSPFSYSGALMSIAVERYKAYEIKATLEDGSEELATIDLSEPQYEELTVASVPPITFFPQEVDFTLAITPQVSGYDTIEYKLLLEKDGAEFNVRQYGQRVARTAEGSAGAAPAETFKYSLTEGKYTAKITNGYAYAFNEEGQLDGTAELDTLIFDFVVDDYETRRNAFSCSMKVDTILKKKPPKLAFPIVFYFDNDKPIRRNGDARRAGETYKEAYDKYVKATRIQEYVDFNEINLKREGVFSYIWQEEEKKPVSKRIYKSEEEVNILKNSPVGALQVKQLIEDNFFEQKLVAQFESFTEFMDGLIAYLDSPGNDPLDLIIQGYCSPLGGSAYNKMLAQRRIECILKYMVDYRDGALEQYLVIEKGEGFNIQLDINDANSNERLRVKLVPLGVAPQYDGTPTEGDPGRYDYRAIWARKVEIKDVSGGGRLQIPGGTPGNN
jgi:hypothetical protein